MHMTKKDLKNQRHICSYNQSTKCFKLYAQILNKLQQDMKTQYYKEELNLSWTWQSNQEKCAVDLFD